MASDEDLFRKEFEEKVKDFYKKKYHQAYIGSDKFILIDNKYNSLYMKTLILMVAFFFCAQPF